MGQWQYPTNEIEKDFAIDALITMLYEVQSLPLGT
jgi:hypothetical protein